MDATWAAAALAGLLEASIRIAAVATIVALALRVLHLGPHVHPERFRISPRRHAVIRWSPSSRA